MRCASEFYHHFILHSSDEFTHIFGMGLWWGVGCSGGGGGSRSLHLARSPYGYLWCRIFMHENVIPHRVVQNVLNMVLRFLHTFYGISVTMETIREFTTSRKPMWGAHQVQWNTYRKTVTIWSSQRQFKTNHNKVPWNLLYKRRQMQKLKCFSSSLAVIFAQSIKARC